MTALLPYALLLTSICLARFAGPRAAVLALMAGAVAGLWAGRLEPVALLSVLALLLSATRRSPFGDLVSLALALLLSNYVLPGFVNLPYFDQVRFSPDAAPFTMYLNFDKATAGVLLYLFVVREGPPLGLRGWRVIVRTWGAVTLTLMPLALLSDYVRWDVKFPPGGWMWMLNNFFFVCLAEEAVFRGVIQARLREWAGPVVAITVAAFAFGLQHHRGGVAYIALASVAGLFYGYAFEKTRRLEASMLVHFGLNLVHFLFFSYPALAR